MKKVVKKMHKIGIISDTHGMLRNEVLEALQDCEMIFHGGDINKQKIIDGLSTIAPVQVVRGNNDKEWAETIPKSIMVEVCGLRIFMVHNKKDIPKDLSEVNLIIYRHSHKYEEKIIDRVQYLNPGSCGPRRFHQEITFAILYIEDNGEFWIEKQQIAHPEKKSSKNGQSWIPTDLALMIPSIIKEIDAGKSVKQIAGKYKISEELSEQIVRMYLTHPGVDVDGILRRIGV